MPTELDPYPYRIRVRQQLLDPAGLEDYMQAREGERIASPGWLSFWDAETEECIFDPRPGYSQSREDYP